MIFKKNTPNTSSTIVIIYYTKNSTRVKYEAILSFELFGVYIKKCKYFFVKPITYTLLYECNSQLIQTYNEYLFKRNRILTKIM